MEDFQSKAKGIFIILAAAAIILIILYFGGFFKSQAQKESEKIEDETDARADVIRQSFKFSDVFSDSYYKGKQTKFTDPKLYLPYLNSIIKSTDLRIKAYIAGTGVGVSLIIDFDTLISVFNSMKYKSDISILALLYKSQQQKDLLVWLNTICSNSQLAKIEYVISKLI